MHVLHVYISSWYPRVVLVNVCSYNVLLMLPQNDHRIRIIAIPARRSSRVEFSEASVDDNGVYQCIISNDAGSIMHSFIVELMQG